MVVGLSTVVFCIVGIQLQLLFESIHHGRATTAVLLLTSSCVIYTTMVVLRLGGSVTVCEGLGHVSLRYMFSSFDPEMCLALRQKQARFPIILNTWFGYEDVHDNTEVDFTDLRNVLWVSFTWSYCSYYGRGIPWQQLSSVHGTALKGCALRRHGCMSTINSLTTAEGLD